MHTSSQLRSVWSPHAPHETIGMAGMASVLLMAGEANFALQVNMMGPVSRALGSDDWGNASQGRGWRTGLSARLLFVDRKFEYLCPNAGRATGPSKVVVGDGVRCLCL
jgi:hypothetical protein